MKLSIIIPCYNERATLETLLDRVCATEGHDKELILVDDFSTDGTRELIRERLADRVDQVFFHEENLGKGAALATGIAAATGDIVLIQDADLEYNPAEYPKLVQPILDGHADVVYGSRFMGDSPTVYSTFGT